MKYIENLVSVVIPTHNRAELLKRAVLTALNQTYKSIEVIVVSDGSEDNTDDIMQGLLEKYTNLYYISYHPGQGGNHARNEGIHAAKGQWVAFLDDDDEWHSDKIEKQLEIAKKNNELGLICTAINSVHDDTGRVNRFIPSAPIDSSKEILLKNCIGSTTTAIALHELLDQCGCFDEQLKAMQDYDMWIRLCQITKVGVVTTPCVEYHNLLSNGQISWNYEKYADATYYIASKYKTLREQKLSKKEIKQVKIEDQLIIARKAMKGGKPDKVRLYAKEAMKIQLNKQAIIYYIASFFSLGFINKVLHIVKKVS